MPGFPGTPSIQTVTDVLATIAPSVGNVAGYYVWMVNIATGTKYGPSGKTDSGGNWSIASVPAGIYETFYGAESPTGTAPVQWQAAGVTGYLVALNPPSGKVGDWGGGWWNVQSPSNPSGPATGAGLVDDYASINAAITAAIAAGGGIVYFPPGIYLIGTSLTQASNVLLLGAGRGASILKRKNSTAMTQMVYFGAITKAKLRDLSLDGNKANQTLGQNLVTLDGCTYCEVSDNELTNAKGVGGSNGDAVYITGGATDNEVEANLMTTLDRSGVSIVYGSRNGIRRNKIVSPALIGVDIEPNADANPCEYNEVDDNTVISAGSRSIMAEGANSSPAHTASIQHTKIRDNTIVSGGHRGIELGSNGDWSTIARNDVALCQRDGLITSSDHIRVVDNVIRDNSQAGAGTYQGYDMFSSKSVVSGNVIGCKANPNQQGFGLYEEAGKDFNVIVANAFDGNANPVHIGGASTILIEGGGERPIEVTAASAAALAGFRLPHGVLPTAPVNGDMWSTTAGLFIRINGVTKTVTLT